MKGPIRGPKLFYSCRVVGSEISFTIVSRHGQKLLCCRDLLQRFLLVDQIEIIIVTCVANLLCSADFPANLSRENLCFYIILVEISNGIVVPFSSCCII